MAREVCVMGVGGYIPLAGPCHGCWGILLSLCPVMGVGVYSSLWALSWVLGYAPLARPCHGYWGIFLSLYPTSHYSWPRPSLTLSLVAISFWVQYSLIACCLVSRAPPPVTELGTE